MRQDRIQHRRGGLTGRVTKFLVLALWIVLAGTLSSFATKLTSAENNNGNAWLPHAIESVREPDQAR